MSQGRPLWVPFRGKEWCHQLTESMIPINEPRKTPVSTLRRKRMMPPADRIYDPNQWAKEDPCEYPLGLTNVSTTVSCNGRLSATTFKPTVCHCSLLSKVCQQPSVNSYWRRSVSSKAWTLTVKGLSAAKRELLLSKVCQQPSLNSCALTKFDGGLDEAAVNWPTTYGS